MIVDTTLREGSQLFKAYFTGSDRKKIMSSLAEAGIEEIEAGWTGMKGLEEIIGWSGPELGNTVISAWLPCREKDIIEAADMGLKRINLGVPSSGFHIRKRLGKNKEELLEMVSRSVRLAALMGLEVSVGLEDAEGADFHFVTEIIKRIEYEGGFRVRFSDTRGLITPVKVSRLISYFRKITKLKIGTHFHNDFGMACANSYTALEAGADYTDASILGAGERAGITPLEEIASRLVIADKKKGYSLNIIKELCRTVSELAEISVSRIKPFAGSDIFSSESGIHLDAIGKDPSLMEPFSPESLGEKRVKAIGWKSGRSALKTFLAENRINSSESEIEILVDKIRELSFSRKRPLNIEEIKSVAEEALKSA